MKDSWGLIKQSDFYENFQQSVSNYSSCPFQMCDHTLTDKYIWNVIPDITHHICFLVTKDFMLHWHTSLATHWPTALLDQLWNSALSYIIGPTLAHSTRSYIIGPTLTFTIGPTLGYTYTYMRTLQTVIYSMTSKCTVDLA